MTALKIKTICYGFLALFAFKLASADTLTDVAQLEAEPTPISIIIDDMGYNRRLGQQAISLPGKLAYAFLPGTPHAKKLAEQAHINGKRVLLHLPMQGSVSSHKHEPHTLHAEMSEPLFRDTLKQHLASIPFISGVNNHMGSSLTPMAEPMNWLMNELAGHQLFFIDSRTTHLTVTKQSAATFNVPFAERDVFLDNIKTEEAIAESFRKFIYYAKNRSRNRNGAIAIAHPHPITISTLHKLLSEPTNGDYKLVDVSFFLHSIDSNSKLAFAPDNGVLLK